jgi:hypothetical protein
MTRFTCDFENPATGEKRVIEVVLPPDELERAGGNELHALAYALRRAYRDVPRGFLHTRIEQEYLQ